LNIINVMTMDVEDYFHVSAFEKCVQVADWDRYPRRVEKNMQLVLEMLGRHEVRATFFVLGWVAVRNPKLVRQLLRAGHEIACHGNGHRRVGTQSRREFREDIRKSKAILEDLCGEPVVGYRAPSYSISKQTLWAFDELLEAGYLYDASVFPVRHDFYGIPDWPRFPFAVSRGPGGDWAPKEGSAAGEASGMLEIPITTLSLLGQNIPIAGGGYFRFFPYGFTRWGLRRINTRDKRPFVFYLHPWELDPDQPRIPGASLKSRFRHYLNLEKTERRFDRLLSDFKFAAVQDVVQGLSRKELPKKEFPRGGAQPSEESIAA
jgi:polysaccharide deacetylase family protein (PEP-CTERM system associated)